MIWKGTVVVQWWHYPRICLEGLRKNTNNFNHDGLCRPILEPKISLIQVWVVTASDFPPSQCIPFRFISAPSWSFKRPVSSRFHYKYSVRLYCFPHNIACCKFLEATALIIPGDLKEFRNSWLYNVLNCSLA
jgi:hypothetical protein